MQIRRVTAQGSESLEEFYLRAAEQPPYQRTAGLMLALLKELRAPPNGDIVWAATSGTDLLLLSRDDSHAPALVTIQAKTRWYFIEAPLPASARPWPDAWVKGHTDDVASAIQMIRKAVGWSEFNS